MVYSIIQLKLSILIIVYTTCNSSSNKYVWPTPIDINKQFDNLRQFYFATDYKFISRIVCCVCSRFFITTDSNIYKKKTLIILKNKSVLHVNNLYECPDASEFVYEKFPEFYHLVLDSNGFNMDHTVRYNYNENSHLDNIYIYI